MIVRFVKVSCVKRVGQNTGDWLDMLGIQEIAIIFLLIYPGIHPIYFFSFVKCLEPTALAVIPVIFLLRLNFADVGR